MVTDKSQQNLMSAIEKVCDSKQVEWLRQSLVSLPNNAGDLEQVVMLIARARRRLGVNLLANNLTDLKTSAGTLPTSHWSAGDAGRILLVCELLKCNRAENLLDEIFLLTSEPEQVSIVKGIALYANDLRYKSIILEAGRTNSIALFEAVATKNPYPKKHYTDHEFNQLVLKSLFIGVNISQIMGLKLRANPELSRMCEDYYDERVAATRSVPPDIWLAMALYASQRGMELIIDALQSEDVNHRYFATLAMTYILPVKSEIHNLLEDRVLKEENLQIKQLLNAILVTN